MSDSARSARDPLYTHDCPSCVYLGTTRDDEEGDVDLYVHPRTIEGLVVAQSYLARYGNESQEYISTLSFIVLPEATSLDVAKERADAIGIPPQRVEQDVLDLVESDQFRESLRENESRRRNLSRSK